jgi:uncharacterized membrane protein
MDLIPASPRGDISSHTTWHYYRRFLFLLFHGLQQANVLFCSFFKKIFQAIHAPYFFFIVGTLFYSLFILMTLTFVSYPFQTRVESTPAKNLDVGENNPVPV